MKRLLLVACLLGYTGVAMPLKLDRVILSTNNDPKYIQFWPIVAKAWKELVGLQPTLALIGDESVKIDESLGDVIRFKPIPGVHDGRYAQAVRHLLPALFPDDGCIISDIDMIPLSKDYYIDSVADVPDDQFVVYRDGVKSVKYGYNGEKGNRYVMCYCAAKGSVYGEVFNLQNFSDIPAMVRRWYSYGWKRATDEKILFKVLHEWEDFDTRCTRLGHGVDRRLMRKHWGYDAELLAEGYYIDAHLPRPYAQHRKTIDDMLAFVNAELR